MTATASPRRRRDFPGWHMVWTVAGTCTVAYGVLFYAFAVFVVLLAGERAHTA